MAAVEDLGAVLHRSVTNGTLHVVTLACLCSLENSIVRRFESHNCLYQPPMVLRQGWEHYSVIAFDERDIAALHDELEADREIDVLSKTELSETQIPHGMLAPVDRLFGDLTDRQLVALPLALDEGITRSPGAVRFASWPSGRRSLARPSRNTCERPRTNSWRTPASSSGF